MIPRQEYPRPQFVRERWQNLNGPWEFEFDFGNSGVERKLFEQGEFSKNITVPFCPESDLSGIGYRDFINGVWYRRKVDIQPGGQRVILHFGAVDYLCRVWVNGLEAGTHSGGYASFQFDITDQCRGGENTIVVYAEDHVRDPHQARGKQSELYASHGCDYTRTTGIWQTVWLEYVPQTYIRQTKIITDDKNPSVSVSVELCGPIEGIQIRLTAFYEGNKMGTVSAVASGASTSLFLPLKELHLWEPGRGRLYDISYELLKDGAVLDHASGYFGIRTILLQDGKILLNHKPVFQRLVLDQGFYPDGVCTAPTDEALKRDIELSMAAGFNGARLHQKVFEERFLYWADRLGYLVWGEYGNWGLDHTSAFAVTSMLPEWLEILQRDFNHPSIVGWCPFNETWDYLGRQQDNAVLRTIYLATKAVDPTRPVIDTSGNYHVITDIYDIHDYEQSVEIYRERYQRVADGEYYEPHPKRQSYGGQPYFVSEYGGAWWAPGKENGWGYGDAPKSEEEFAARYNGLTSSLLSSKNVCAFCYTQLTDVEQECNGIYSFDRSPKFSEEIYQKIRAVNQQKAEIEK